MKLRYCLVNRLVFAILNKAKLGIAPFKHQKKKGQKTWRSITITTRSILSLIVAHQGEDRCSQY